MTRMEMMDALAAPRPTVVKLPSRDQILAAFKLVRQQGIAARANFRCCGSCATAEAPADKPMVYWHHQDESGAWGGRGRDRGLHIGFCAPDNDNHEAEALRAAQALVAALIASGVEERFIEWDGTLGRRVHVRLTTVAGEVV